MADDGEIKINTKVDTSGLDKGVNEVEGKLKKASKSIGLSSKLTAGAIVTAAVTAAKKIGEVVRETSEAYKVQAKAETAVKTAALNNPYINDEAVDGLKRFASQLQETSNIGDETTLQYAAQLVAAGRTQEEIQNILQQSANLAASGAMSFDSAVKNLAKTYGGLAGELGESIPALRTLSQEELKQGKAIEVIAKQYGGFAENLADSRVQMENAKGDLKETIGEMTAPAANAWDRFWKGFYEKGNKALQWYNSKVQQLGMSAFKNKAFKQMFDEFVDENGQTALGISKFSDDLLKNWDEYFNNKKKLNDEEKAAQALVKSEIKLRQQLKEKEEIQLRIKEKQLETQKKINEETNKADDLAINSNKALEQELAKIKLKHELTGEEGEEQEIYNAILNNYISLLTDENGIIKENYPVALKRIEQLKDAKAALDDVNDAEDLRNRLAEVGADVDQSEYERIKEQGDNLLALKQEVIDSEVLKEEEKAEEIKKIDEEIAQNKKDLWAQATTDIKGYIDQLVDVAQQTADLMNENAQMQTDTELATLETKYRKGEIGEKEYAKKKEQIQKEGAKEQYKINMFAWSASLATAAANIAEGVTKALAAPFPMNIANGALVSAAGAAQIAAIIASKPQPPAFATGGIVGGNSYSGDNVIARVNSGEMILNTAQQQSLWRNISQGTAGGQPNIVINNSASNLVTAKPQISRGQIELMIDARVNDSLKNGRYDSSLTMAQQGMSGDYLGI